MFVRMLLVRLLTFQNMEKGLLLFCAHWNFFFMLGIHFIFFPVYLIYISIVAYYLKIFKKAVLLPEL